MRTSCIQNPKSSRFIQLHKWQKTFCNDNLCAALLLSHFSGWHDWKIQHDQYYRRCNDIAEAHGESRSGNEDAYLFFTMDDFVKALMGLFGKKSISEGLELLVQLGVISVHKNPNPRYCFDKTKYFKFYPDVCNTWLKNYSSSKTNNEFDVQVVDNSDNVFLDDRSFKNARPSSENGRPSRKNGQAITDNTNNTTNKKTNNNTKLKRFDDGLILKPETQAIVDSLIQKGMKAREFHSNSFRQIQNLHDSGAHLSVFLEAYSKAERATHGRAFNLKYLFFVVEGLLTDSRKNQHSSIKRSHDGKKQTHHLKNAAHWLGDIIEGEA